MSKRKTTEEKLHSQAPKPVLSDKSKVNQVNSQAPPKGTNVNNQFR